MPDKTRWRIEKDDDGRWCVYHLHDTALRFHTWAGAMGYVNLRIAVAQGKLP